MSEHKTFYDKAATSYDLMINWDVRLKREIPFFKQLFEKHQVERVLDVGCSSGRHAIAFSQTGYQVHGCDASTAMVALAKRNAQEVGAAVSFDTASLTALTTVIKQPVQALTCLGNTLPHLHTEAERNQFFQQVGALVQSGGVFVLQIVNYLKEMKEQRRTRPITHGASADGKELFFLRVFDYLPDEMVQGNFLILEREKGNWKLQTNSVLLKPVYKEEIECSLQREGFFTIQFFADYQSHVWDQHAADVIIVAQKR